MNDELKINPDIIGAIDCGASNGGIAFRGPNRALTTINMPETIEDIIETFRNIKESCEGLQMLFCIEKQQAFMGNKYGDGERFRFDTLLANYNQLKTTLTSEGIPFVEVHPRAWQSTLKLVREAEEPRKVEPKIEAVLKRRKEKGQKTTERDLEKIRKAAIKAVRKERYKLAAAFRYPTHKVTLKNCDAILITDFLEHKIKYDQKWLEDRIPSNIYNQMLKPQING